MADSRYAGEAGLQAVFGQIKAAIAEKQDKINGMGLSHNDYSNAEKQKNAQNASDIVALNNDIDDIIEKRDGDATLYQFAPVVTVEDAVPGNVALRAKVEPQQDLHGYDKPWVGGAGKNKLPLVLALLKTLNTSGTWVDNVYTLNNVVFTVNLDDGGNVTSIKANGTASAKTIFYLGIFADFLTVDTSYIINSNIYPESDQGAVLQILKANDAGYVSLTEPYSFTYASEGNAQKLVIRVDNAATANNNVFTPMIRLATETDATFAPYSNICPIAQYDSCKITRMGKNWCPYNSMKILNGEYFTLPAGTYTFSLKILGSNKYSTSHIGLYDDPNHFALCTVRGTAGAVVNTQITLAKSTQLFIRVVNMNADGNGYYCDNIQIEKGETVTSYEPYKGNDYQIELNGNTYYGQLRIDTQGNVYFDVDMVMLIIDENTQNMTLHNTGDSTAVFKIVTGQACVNDARQKSNISTHDTNGWNSQIAKNCFVMGQEGNLYIQVPLTVASTLSDFTTWLASNNVQILYPLKDADIITIQLTPQQIQLLKGQNTIYADTGDIEVTVNNTMDAIGSVQEQVNGLAEKIATITIIRKGEVNFANLAVDNVFSSDITFDTPMPNANYTVTASASGTTVAVCNIGNRTKNGFTVYVRNIGTAAIGGTVMWQAIG